MRLKTMTFVVIAGVIPAIAKQPARPDASIRETAEEYRRAVLAGDAAAVAATYREDAVEMAPGRPPLKGRAAIEQYYRRQFQGPAKFTAFTFSYSEAASIGDSGYVVGTYQQKLSGPAGPLEDTGKFVVIVKRTGNNWRAAYVIYNSDRSQVPSCAAEVSVPFPQHDLISLIGDYASSARKTLLHLSIIGLGGISCASILVIVSLRARVHLA